MNNLKLLGSFCGGSPWNSDASLKITLKEMRVLKHQSRGRNLSQGLITKEIGTWGWYEQVYPKHLLVCVVFHSNKYSWGFTLH